MSFHGLLWLFPLAVTLHNGEEAIWLPHWSRRSVIWRTPVTPGIFRFAVVILTLLAFAVTALSALTGRQSPWTYLVFGFMIAMLINAIAPHVVLSVALRNYMPGTATAVLVNLPALSLLVALALRENYVSGWPAIESSVAVSAFGLLSIPALFRLGKLLHL